MYVLIKVIKLGLCIYPFKAFAAFGRLIFGTVYVFLLYFFIVHSNERQKRYSGQIWGMPPVGESYNRGARKKKRAPPARLAFDLDKRFALMVHSDNNDMH